MYFALSSNSENAESRLLLCRDCIVFHCVEVPDLFNQPSVERHLKVLETKLNTKSPTNPKNLSTKVEKKENSFTIEYMFNLIVVHITDSLLKRLHRRKETLPFCIIQQTQPITSGSQMITSREVDNTVCHPELS